MSDIQKDEKTIFITAAKLISEAQRTAYVNEAGADDPNLKARITALLKAHEKEGDFLDGLIDKSDTTLEASHLTEGPGKVIGRYRLLEKIGEGGFGVVYLAE